VSSQLQTSERERDGCHGIVDKWPLSSSRFSSRFDRGRHGASQGAQVERLREHRRPPDGVNLIALETRFEMTWPMRSGSADTGAASASKMTGGPD
jgi:hypothetical protein